MSWLVRLGAALPEDRLTPARARAEACAAEQAGRLRAISFDMLDPAAQKALVRAGKCFRAGRLPPAAAVELLDRAGVPISAMVGALAAALEELRTAEEQWQQFESESAARAIAALRECAGDPRIQEAILLQSPGAHLGVVAFADQPPAEEKGPRRKQRAQLMALMLQRLCAKNDTNSFFGPTAGLSWRGPAQLPFEVVSEVLERRVHFANWAIESIGRKLAAGELPALRRLWANPTLISRGEESLWAAIELAPGSNIQRSYCQAPLSAAAHGLLTPGAVAADLSGEADGPQLAELVDVGVALEYPYALPAGLFAPEDALRSDVAALPPSASRDQTLARLDALTAAAGVFRDAGSRERAQLFSRLEATVEALASMGARRGHGEMYVDRLVVHEACGVQVRGHPLSEEGRRKVEAVLPALASIGFLGVAAGRARVRRWFEKKAPRGGTMPLLEVELGIHSGEPAAVTDELPEVSAAEAAAARLRACFEAALATDDAEVRLPLASIEEALSPLDWRGVDAGYFSVDVLVARGGGGELPVIGECHGILGAQSVFLEPLRERDAMLDRMRKHVRALVPRGRSVELVMPHGHKIDSRHPISELDLEVGARSFRPRSEVVRHCEVEVFLDDGALRMRSPKGELVPLLTNIYAGPHLLSPVPPVLDDLNEKFFPESLLPRRCVETRCPRLVVGGVVVRRASWRIDVADVAGALLVPGRLLLEAERLRRRFGFPRHMFAVVPGEPKPIFVDWQSPIILGAFEKMLSAASGPKVTLSEMLPGPEEVFLEAPGGRRTFELRLGVAVRPPDR